MHFILTIQDKRIDNLAELLNLLLTLPDGQYKTEIKKHYNRRTSAQNRYLWGVVYPSVLEGLIASGNDQWINVEDVHELCLQTCGSKQVVLYETGEVYNIPSRSRKMTTTEFMAYIQSITNWSREFLGIDIPQADSFLLNEKETEHEQ